MDNRPAVLREGQRVVRWISELTGRSESNVLEQLRAEYRQPGFNVGHDLKQRGVEPYVWSDGMERFYSETDAFLFELVIWNLNQLKAWMREACARYVHAAYGTGARVLNIGDGLGIDTIHLAEQGQDASYFELPGFTRRFAERAFEHADVKVTQFGEAEEVPQNHFDAVICLDVLEHVPDPVSFLKMLIGYVRPGGRLLIHESFLWVHPSNPTHLASVRRYSGDLSLYRNEGLILEDGEIGWNPLVLVKPDGVFKGPSPFRPKMLMLRLAGLYMCLGRFSVVPFLFGDRLRQRKGRWFDDIPASP
ncbi:MAG: class I SAM-dependent methyltransferase [Phycisphaerae bacterium]